MFTAKSAASAAQGRFSSIPSLPLRTVYVPSRESMPEKITAPADPANMPGLPGRRRYKFPPAVHTERKRRERAVIKGISKRVIVVKSPDRRFFEEAIFIVKEGIAGVPGVTAEQVVEEARRVADGFVKKHHKRWWQSIPAPGYVALGAVIASALWCVGLLL